MCLIIIKYCEKFIFFLIALIIFQFSHSSQIKPRYTVPYNKPNLEKYKTLKKLDASKFFLESQPVPESQPMGLSKKFIAIAKRSLIATYDIEKKQLILRDDISNVVKKEESQPIESSFSKRFDNVSHYYFDSNKRYILIKKEIISETSFTPFAQEKAKNIPFIAKSLVEGTKSKQISFELIDTKTLTSIILPHSITNSLITYQFSPESKSILFATRIPIGAISAAKSFFTRTQEPQAILQYHLFDIESQKIMQTFSQVKTVDFITEDSLFVKDDKGNSKKIIINKAPSTSFFSRITSFITPVSSVSIQEKELSEADRFIRSNTISIVYDPIAFTLTIKDKVFNDIGAYWANPLKKLIIATNISKDKTYLINTDTLKIIRTFFSIPITYELNTDESRLLILSKEQTLQGTSSHYTYQLINTKNGEPIRFNPSIANIQSAFFDNNQEDIAIVSEDIKTVYNSKTGKSYKKAQEKNIVKEVENLSIKMLSQFLKSDDESQEQLLPSLFEQDKKLSEFISHLSLDDQRELQARQLQILNANKPKIKKILKSAIQKKWTTIKNIPLLQDIGKATLAGMISAANALTQQALKIGTGNLPALNPTQLLIAALNSIFLNVTNTLVKSKFTAPAITQILPAISAATITQAIIRPSLEINSLQIIMPSIGGTLQSWILMESMAIVNEIVRDNQTEIKNIINNINFREVLLGKPIAPRSAISETILSEIQDIIHHDTISQIILEVGSIVFESAVMGAVLHSLGFGYVTPSTLEAMQYAILNGIAQGALAHIAVLLRKQDPGALLHITAEPLLLTLTGYSKSTAAAATIQAIASETIKLLGEIIQETGGIYQALEKGKAALDKSVHSRWQSTFAMITNGWEKITESIEGISTESTEGTKLTGGIQSTEGIQRSLKQELPEELQKIVVDHDDDSEFQEMEQQHYLGDYPELLVPAK